MTTSHDGEPDPQDLADITLFVHIDGERQGKLNLRPVETRGLQEPETLLLSGDGRYELQGMLGRGGSGEVHRVLDRKLNRVVALKLIREEYSADAQMINRFTREAQVISQLEHPSIIPIYDLGRADSGRWYLTMKEVHGRTLRECIAEMHGSPQGMDPTLLRQAIDSFQRVCTAVGFAHGKGVLHRDLKPDNIMIAQFGQVYVLDWGLARVLRTPGSDRRTGRAAIIQGQTDHGMVMGTPAYMSPEQARADLSNIGPASDVWSLGATLFAILYGQPPYSGSAQEVLDQVERGPPKTPDVSGLPAELIDLWQQCMRSKPSDRPPNGTAVAASLSLYLEGRRNQERALALVEDAQTLTASLNQARHEARKARQRAASALRGLRQSDDLETKERAWTQEDLSRIAQAKLDQAYDQILTKARMAHDQAPRLHEVRVLLAGIYRQRAEEAMQHGDAISAQGYKALVATYDDGRHREFLEQAGRMMLDWSPRSAQARLCRYEPRARRLTPILLASQELRPGVSQTLPSGSYLVELRHNDRAPLRIPVHVKAEQGWTHQPPGSESSEVVRMPPRDQLARQERYVVGGWFVCGGDDQAMTSLPRQRLWVDPFSIAARPVSHQEYLAFLNDTTRRAPSKALPHAPALPSESGELQPLYHYDPVDRHWSLIPQVGELFLHPTNPVIGVRWIDACAYLLWLREQSGQPWRLPGELEWEIAARGVDGRSFPWGERSDPSFFCHQDTHLEVLGPPATGRFSVDCSPYGVMGMAGGVSEWCADAFHPQGPERRGPRVIRPEPPSGEDILHDENASLRSVRGGAWRLSKAHGRCASRSGQPADRRADFIGFRICRDAPEHQSKR
jgi:serine/threonine protein kinase/formylglycine-generating enzyme required for sulfatase activity